MHWCSPNTSAGVAGTPPSFNNIPPNPIRKTTGQKNGFRELFEMQRAPSPPEFAQPRLSRSNSGHPHRGGTNLGVFLPIWLVVLPSCEATTLGVLIRVISPYSNTVTGICNFGWVWSSRETTIKLELFGFEGVGALGAERRIVQMLFLVGNVTTIKFQNCNFVVDIFCNIVQAPGNALHDRKHYSLIIVFRVVLFWPELVL